MNNNMKLIKTVENNMLDDKEEIEEYDDKKTTYHFSLNGHSLRCINQQDRICASDCIAFMVGDEDPEKVRVRLNCPIRSELIFFDEDGNFIVRK